MNKEIQYLGILATLQGKVQTLVEFLKTDKDRVEYITARLEDALNQSIKSTEKLIKQWETKSPK